MGHGSRMVHGLGLCTLFYVDAPEDVHYSGQTDQHTPSDASLPVSHSGTIMSTEKSTLAKDSSGSLNPTPDAHISKSKFCFRQKFQISSSPMGCPRLYVLVCDDLFFHSRGSVLPRLNSTDHRPLREISSLSVELGPSHFLPSIYSSSVVSKVA